ncbi:hypothetical protein BGX31_002705 [Mortierella sp. GBA43]|nr:hypothetical protein BGX31_002705 [Mortierella sp. GBA43]
MKIAVYPITAGAVALSASVTIKHNDIPIGTFTTSSHPTKVKDGKLSGSFQDSVVKIIPGQEDAFTNDFMASLIAEPEHTFVLSGTIDATIHTLGLPLIPESFKVASIAFEAPVTLKGCANFPETPFVKQISFTHDPDTDSYVLTSLVNVINPSHLVLTMGDVTYHLLDKSGANVGTSLFKNVHLKQGDNLYTMATTITSKDTYNELTTKGCTLTLKGFNGSSKNPILAQALKAVESEIAFPKLDPAV